MRYIVVAALLVANLLMASLAPVFAHGHCGENPAGTDCNKSNNEKGPQAPGR